MKDTLTLCDSDVSVVCFLFCSKLICFFFQKERHLNSQWLNLSILVEIKMSQSTDIFLALYACCISHHLCLQCAMLRLREDAHLLGRFTIIAEEVPQMSSRGKLEMLVKSRASQEEIGARREQVG